MAGNKWRELNPWYNLLRYARERCSRRDHDAYHYYGGRGVKCLLTVKEMRQLWERDKGWKLKRPSLERKDSKGDYTFENCEVIELEENLERAVVQKRKERLRWVSTKSKAWERHHDRRRASGLEAWAPA
jgi:hypothetical protein